jgi:hypothetical protein
MWRSTVTGFTEKSWERMGEASLSWVTNLYAYNLSRFSCNPQYSKFVILHIHCYFVNKVRIRKKNSAAYSSSCIQVYPSTSNKWDRVLEKLRAAQINNKFSAPWYITAFTRTCHWILYRGRRNQSTPISWLSVLITSSRLRSYLQVVYSTFWNKKNTFSSSRGSHLFPINNFMWLFASRELKCCQNHSSAFASQLRSCVNAKQEKSEIRKCLMFNRITATMSP